MIFDLNHPKEQRLVQIIQTTNPLAIAFSGGIDSSYLLFMAVNAIGKDNVIAITAQGPLFSPFETRHIQPIINQLKVNHQVFELNAMSCEPFVQNPPDRCYHCKKMVFSSIRGIADAFNTQHIAHGANLDDLNDYRPGSKAACEYHILSPLVSAQISKSDIQMLAKKHQLQNWNQPAMACLATRIPYHSTITLEKLDMIRRAENILYEMGIFGARVRHIDGNAKIEVRQKQLMALFTKDNMDSIHDQLTDIGFKRVAGPYLI